jgi:hypothetical protein
VLIEAYSPLKSRNPSQTLAIFAKIIFGFVYIAFLRLLTWAFFNGRYGLKNLLPAFVSGSSPQRAAYLLIVPVFMIFRESSEVFSEMCDPYSSASPAVEDALIFPKNRSVWPHPSFL